MTISRAFAAFIEHAPGFPQPWMAMVQQGLPGVGHRVVSALPAALAALDGAGA